MWRARGSSLTLKCMCCNYTGVCFGSIFSGGSSFISVCVIRLCIQNIECFQYKKPSSQYRWGVLFGTISDNTIKAQLDQRSRAETRPTTPDAQDLPISDFTNWLPHNCTSRSLSQCVCLYVQPANANRLPVPRRGVCSTLYIVCWERADAAIGS